MRSLYPRRPRFTILAVLYILGLVFFYLKYVPLIRSFQALLIPVLVLVCSITVWKPDWGMLFFVFVFPLINNLPYLFGINENTPHAPTALVLFLFFFLGWLINESWRSAAPSRREGIFLPMRFFALVVLVSAIITVFRLTDFYPVRADGIYELATNIKGVSAGGAIMSTLFCSLNYWTGLAFFFVLIRLLRCSALIRKTIRVLAASTLLSLAFGFWQHFKDLRLGNTLRGAAQGMINGTFKDPLSFGAYLAMVGTIILGIGLGSKGGSRLFFFFIVIMAWTMSLLTGSRAGILGLVIAAGLFAVLTLQRQAPPGPKKVVLKRRVITFSFVAILAAVVFSGLIISHGDLFKSRTLVRLDAPLKKELVGFWDRPRGRLWTNALLMLKDYPLTGVGIGNYIIEVSNYSARHGVPVVNSQSAENVLLQVGSELGIVGIFLFLWIVWELATQMRKTYAGFQAGDGDRFILIGALAGMIAFFTNSLAHTFIGSYEIIYAFWFLTAVVLCLPAREGAGTVPVLVKSRLPRVMPALLVIYAIIFFWNSTHSLSLAAHTREFGLKQNFGFYPEERTDDGRVFSWTGRSAGLTLKIEKPQMEIPVHASHPDIQNRPVRVKICLARDLFKQKKLLDEIILADSSWKLLTFRLPQEVGREIILVLKVSRTWNPQKASRTPDPRNLGIAVGTIRFRDSRTPPGP
jgi:O-antigen ligase